MPQVKFVNLSFNRLSDQLEALNKQAAHSACWAHLKNLVLNSTRVDWASVQALLKLLPALEELHLSLNEYAHVELHPSGVEDLDKCPKKQAAEEQSEKLEAAARCNANGNCNGIDEDKENSDCGRVNGECNDRVNENTQNGFGNEPNSPKHIYPQVKKLHFSGNPVCHWREICKLGYAFPNLESLVLNECPLRSLSLDSNPDGVEYNRSESGCESDVPTESPHNSFRFVLPYSFRILL